MSDHPPMAPASGRPAAARLAVAAAAFLAWLAYLGFLVFTMPETAAGQPLVLSRPQFMVSELDVIARVEADSTEAVVEEVLHPAESSEVAVGDTLEVGNLRASHPPTWGATSGDPAGPGKYLLPLRRIGELYEVVPIPESPGYPTRQRGPTGPFIYPATPETRAQYGQIPKP